MEAIAKTRHLKGSPRKARLVIDLIRGRNVSQALNILKFTDKRAAEPITKTLRSAIANATYLAEQQNIAIDPDDLFVKTCFVDMGAHKNRRRMRPAPQGRAFREQRHYCHITILVSSDAPVDTKSARKSLQTSGEKGNAGSKGKDAPKPEAIKHSSSDKVKEPKKVQAETPVAPIAAETVEAQTPFAEVSSAAETPTTNANSETATSDNFSRVQTGESETATTGSTVIEESAETKVADPLSASEFDSSEEAENLTAAKNDARGTAEASDAKDVVSQTPAERNETKKADQAQQKDNDILELQ